MSGPRLSLTDMARRVSRDIPSGAYVNLGIGMPTLVGDVVSPEKEIVYHSENGILGMGPAPAPQAPAIPPAVQPAAPVAPPAGGTSGYCDLPGCPRDRVLAQAAGGSEMRQ